MNPGEELVKLLAASISLSSICLTVLKAEDILPAGFCRLSDPLAVDNKRNADPGFRCECRNVSRHLSACPVVKPVKLDPRGNRNDVDILLKETAVFFQAFLLPPSAVHR